jgi:cysteinyl-tRNA synthetase
MDVLLLYLGSLVIVILGFIYLFVREARLRNLIIGNYKADLEVSLSTLETVTKKLMEWEEFIKHLEEEQEAQEEIDKENLKTSQFYT